MNLLFESRIMKKLLAALIVLAFSLFLTPPALACDPSDWRRYALYELENIEEFRASGRFDNRLAHSLAYQIDLTAFRDGWHDPKVQELLYDLYDLKKYRGGYGMSERWDAFQDGTWNAESTVYTVTVADHVGPVLLEGYRNGAVPESEIYYLVDSLMDIKVIGTGHGKCMIYSSNVRSDSDWCVINVSAGGAAFLQEAWDAGIRRPGQLALVNDLKPFITWSYEKAHEERVRRNRIKRVDKPGFWAYAYVKRADGWKFSRQGRAQDWNHNGYTAESAWTLGLPSGRDSVRKMLDTSSYRSPKIIRRTMERQRTNPRAVQGRMRVQALMPNYKCGETWQDANRYRFNHLRRGPTDYAQGGRWAARLS